MNFIHKYFTVIRRDNTKIICYVKYMSLQMELWQNCRTGNTDTDTSHILGRCVDGTV